MVKPSPPLRPATPIDVELAKPHPDDERGKPSQRERAEAAEVPHD
jgi:hypothetical protein